jgi:hypothetical protein
MKALAFVLSIFVATVLVSASALALALTAPRHATGFIILASVADGLFVYGPLTFGSVLTYFDPQRSRDARRIFRRLAIVIGAFELVAVAGIVVYSVGVSSPVWLPIAFIGGAAVLFAIAIVVGNALRRYDERRDQAQPSWAPIAARQVTRKIVKVAVTFAAVFAVAAALLWWISGPPVKSGLPIGLSISYALGFAFLASGLACMLVTLPLNRQLRLSLNRDLGRSRKFMRIVVRGKSDRLEEDEKVPAARYAVMLALTLPFTLASITLLYAGILINNLNQLLDDHSFSMVTYLSSAALIVLLVVIFPLQIIRTVRVRRYARDHAELLTPESPAAA